ncbi:hypothetical protein Tco_0154705 [Tanacetum coccineum]
MNQEQIQQDARDEAWVPKANRIKISTTNMRIDPTIPQKEETYQVILDIIKNSTCYNAFLITADVLEIYMQQFWYTIKKINKTTAYEYDLADKKCKVDFEVFRKILNICLRVQGEEFVETPSEESLLTFLIELGYKGQLNKLLNMLVNYMHQPLRTLAAIINKCLSRKTSTIRHHQTFLALFTGLIPLTKTRGKWSKGKKQIVTLKKKTFIFADDNIIPELDVALEPGKSINETEAGIVEEEIRLHETHEHMVIAKPTSVDEYDESDLEPANRPTGRRRPSGIAFRDTLNVSNKKSLDQFRKLKGIQVTSEEEQLVADTKKAIKASKEAFRLQQQTGDSSEGAGMTPEVLDELTGKFTTSSEVAGIVPKVPDEGKGSSATKADAKINWGSEDESHQFDDKFVNEDEITWLSTDEVEKGNEKDDDRSIDIEETDDERTYSENGDLAMTDAKKNVAKKLEVEKGDEEEEQANDDQAQEDQFKDDIVGTLVTMSQKEKPEVPRSSSSHSLSSNYGNQFLNVSSDTSLVGIIIDHADTEINSLLDVQIQQEIPPVLLVLLLDVLVSVIPPQTTTTTPTPLTTPFPTPPITSTTQPVTSLLPATETPDALVTSSEALTVVLQRVSTLEKDVKEIKQVDHSIVIFESIRSQVPPAVNEFLRSSLGDSLQKVLQKHTEEIKQELKQQES